MSFLDLAMFVLLIVFFFNDTATTEIYTLSLHDALPISTAATSTPPTSSASPSSATSPSPAAGPPSTPAWPTAARSEEHTSELQSRQYLVCRLLLEKKKANTYERLSIIQSSGLVLDCCVY